MLGTEDIRKWFRGKMDGRQKRDFKLASMLRTIKWGHREFRRWLEGDVPINKERQKVISRFIEDWEAGFLEFAPDWNYKYANGLKGTLVHRTTPRHVPARLTINFEGRSPRLTLLPKPKRERLPSFPEISGKLTGK